MSYITGCNIWYKEATEDDCANCGQPSHKDVLLSNFPEVRFFTSYTENDVINNAHIAIVNTPDTKWTYGITSYEVSNDTWEDYAYKVKAEAQWAEGKVFEFMIGNELEQYLVDMTVAELISKVKVLATEVKAIFSGKISYAPTPLSNYISEWINAGKGDIDLIGGNIYYDSPTSTEWKAKTQDLINAFGADFYISEFNLHYVNMEDFTDNEDTQAMYVGEMIQFFIDVGIDRMFWLQWHDWSGGHLGVIKMDGTYRKVWDILLKTYTENLCTDSSKCTVDSTRSGFTPDVMFDGEGDPSVESSYWESQLNHNDHWVNYDHGNKKIAKLKMIVHSGRGLTDFKVQASNNGSSWVDLKIGQATTYPSAWFEFTWDSEVSYRYWRILCTNAENGDGGISIGEVQMMEEIIPDPPSSTPVPDTMEELYELLDERYQMI